MAKPFSAIISLLVLLSGCQQSTSSQKDISESTSEQTELLSKHLLHDVDPSVENAHINAIIEIPSGTTDKWELNKSNGNIEWELADNKPRVVNFIGYPGNYGFIPKTLLSKDNGGDGDPLDILILGNPGTRGEIVRCKIIGILNLLDRGEQDDKLIAVSIKSPLYAVNDISELDENYNGISDIVQLWFINYKGPNKIISAGFDGKEKAMQILYNALQQYNNNDTDSHQL